MQKHDIEFHISKFTNDSWPIRRKHAQLLSEKIGNSLETYNKSLKILWQGVISDDKNISYWSKRVLSRVVTIDFMYNMLEDSATLSDPEKSKHLFDIFNSKFIEFYPYILAHSDEFTDENRYYLIRLLASNGDQELIPFFSKLNISKDNRIKNEAIRFLGKFHTENSIKGLIGFLDDENLNIKFSAASNISRIINFMALKDDNKSKAILLNFLPDELKNEFILCNKKDDYKKLVNFLNNLSSSQKLCFLFLTDSSKELINLLLNQPLVEDKLFTLLRFGNDFDESFSDKISNLTKCEYLNIRRLSAKIIREMNFIPSADIVLSLLNEDDEEILKSAFDILAVNPLENVFDTLMEKTKSNSQEIRFFSLHPLSSFFRFIPLREKIIERLLECFKDNYWPVRNQASLTFKYIGEESIPPLLEASMDPNPDIAYWSIITLGQFNSPDIEKKLIKLYENINSLELKLSILKALGNYNSQEIVNLFKKEINDADCKSVVLKSMHNMNREQIQDIISSCTLEIAEDELPFWMKL